MGGHIRTQEVFEVWGFGSEFREGMSSGLSVWDSKFKEGMSF